MNPRSRLLLISVPAILVLLGTISVFFYLRKIESDRIRLAFERDANQVSSRLNERFTVYSEMVDAVRGLMETNPQVTRAEFNQFVRLFVTKPGVQGLGWNPIVRESEREQFVARARSEGFQDYQLKQWSEESDPHWIASQEGWADEYVVVYYLQPTATNEAAFGIDVRSNPVRRKALEKARDQDRKTATAPIILAQDAGDSSDKNSDDQSTSDSESGTSSSSEEPPQTRTVGRRASFLIFAPVFKPGSSPDSTENRRDKILGYVAGVFRVQDIVTEAIPTSFLNAESSVLRIVDITAIEDGILNESDAEVYNNTESRQSIDPQFARIDEFTIADRRWQVELRPTSDYVASRRGIGSWLCLFGGSLLAFLIASLINTLTRRTEKIERTVDQRTKDLQLEINAHLATEQRLIEARDEAERASQAKSDFLSVMSHEIRSPLHAVLGMVDLVQSSTLTHEQQEHMDILENSAESLLTVISDILDFSRIEADKIELQNEPFDVTLMFGKTFKTLAAQASQAGLKLESRIAPEVPQWLVGDWGRIRQILVNLVSNSIKFTRKGKVSVDITGQQLATDRFELKLSVMDTGIGIPADKMDLIFRRFEQADSGDTRAFGGTGLGLAITTRLAELMHGTVKAESKVNQGSTFVATIELTLPADPPHSSTESLTSADEKTPTLSSEQTLSILLVEDGKANQVAARALLTKWGHRVDVAENGLEAIEHWEQNEYDVILMDIRMPLMDGMTATRKIRELETDNGQRTIILAMTAQAVEGDRDKCLECGMDDYIAKPVRKKELLSSLERLTRAPHSM